MRAFRAATFVLEAGVLRAGALAALLGLSLTAPAALAQIPLSQTILIVYGTNLTGLVLGPANNNTVADIQFYLPQEYTGVQLQLAMESGASGSVADFYLMQRAGPGATSANAIAGNTGVAITSVGSWGGVTPFSGLDLKAGTYHLVVGGSAGAPTLACASPATYVYQGPGVSYANLAAQPGESFEPASLFSSSSLNFEIAVYGNPIASGPSLGSNSLLIGSAAGSSSVVLSDSAAWTAASDSSFLHIASSSASGTGNAVVVFNYDAFTGTGTRTGTLTIAGQTVTVTQAGVNYLGPGSTMTLVSSGLGAPTGVAVDSSANVYIADYGNNVIEEWSAATQQVSILGFWTGLMGSGVSLPYGAAVDASGNVYAADYGNCVVKELVAPTQKPIGLASSESYIAPYCPTGVAVDGSGNVYIAYGYGDTIKEWSASTHQLTTLASSGLNYPWAVAVDGSGNVYIADSGNNAIKEWNASTQQVTTLASSGLASPFGVAVDGSGNVYIADTGNNAIKEWDASTQQVTTLASAGLSHPFGVAVDGVGNVYIADDWNKAIKEVPYVFVGPASFTEAAAAGTDSLLPVVPSTQALTGVYAPTSDQSWLTIGAISNGAAAFSFSANTSGSVRVGHIGILGQQITVTQSGLMAQTITFGALADQTYGAAPFTVSATASSGLAVGFASTTTGVCTVSGATVTLAGAGGCTIQATQTGNSSYAAAAPVNQTFQVTAESQFIVFAALGNVTFGGAPFTVSATASSGLPVIFASNTSSVCTVSGSTLTVLGVGTCSITASQAGNGNVLPATSVGQSFTVSPALGTNALVFGSAAGTSSVVLNTTGAWSAAANDSFLHISAGSATGAGSGLVVFTYDAFSGTGARTGTLTIAGLTVVVTQAGVNYLPPGPVMTLFTSTLMLPCGVAVDGSGNVYIADAADDEIWKWTASTQQATTLSLSGLLSPSGVAVDGSGDVYIADEYNDAIKEWIPSTQQLTTLAPSGAFGVAVDSSGNVYMAEFSGDAIGKWSPSTQQVTTLVSSGLNAPFGVAVDGSGNVYIADTLNNAVKEWNASTQQVTTLVSSGLFYPSGVAADGSGNVYIADTENGEVKEWSASTQQVTTLASSGVGYPPSVAVDGLGNVYITGRNAIDEIPYVFVGPASLTEAAAAGSDSLLPVLPSVQSLSGIFAPSSDQSWLTVGSVANAVVRFSFSANGSTSARVAHINVLGKQISVTQNGLSTQTITFGPLANEVYGTAPFTVSATSSSGLAVGFASTTTGVCTVSGTTVTIAGAGTCTVEATQAGNAYYAAATAVDQSFQVTQAAQTISFAALNGVNLGVAPFGVSATASSGLPVSFASSTTAVCTVSGATVTIVAAGTCTLTASQAGNANYAAAVPVTQSFAVVIPPNTLTVGTVTVAPGGAFRVPVTLALYGGATVDAVTFGIQITPMGKAPALTGALTFMASSSITDTPVVSADGTSNQIGVVWGSLSSPLSVTQTLGVVSGTIPVGAISGQCYTVSITGVSVATSQGTISVPVISGPGGAVNAGYSYLVGDVAPYTSDTAPNFGDGTLNILDLIQELFAVNNVPGFRPAACSDRFDAMDLFPADTASARGGDGVLDIRDLISELFRVNNLDMSRPTRVSAGGALPWPACAGGSSGNAESAAVVAAGSLTLGRPEKVGAREERVALYLDAAIDLTRVAVTFALGDQQSQLRFAATADTPASLAQDSQLGVVAAAWLNGVSVAAGERLLLGYVTGPAGFAQNLKVYGLSASGLDEGLEVRLEARGASVLGR